VDDVTASYELASGATPALIVRGEVDLDTRAKFVEALQGIMRDDGAARVDLSGVTFIDSSGISALIECQQRALDQGSQIVLIAPSPPCRRVIQILGLEDFFPVEDPSRATD
jgi:anti-sigma B factor antagonist